LRDKFEFSIDVLILSLLSCALSVLLFLLRLRFFFLVLLDDDGGGIVTAVDVVVAASGTRDDDCMIDCNKRELCCRQRGARGEEDSYGETTSIWR